MACETVESLCTATEWGFVPADIVTRQMERLATRSEQVGLAALAAAEVRRLPEVMLHHVATPARVRHALGKLGGK